MALKPSWAFGPYKKGMGGSGTDPREQYACRAVKELLSHLGYACNLSNAKIGSLADRRIREFQRASQLDEDGEVGKDTMRALLQPVYKSACATHSVVDPQEWAGGQIGWESGLDPGATYTNNDGSLDRGLYQYNNVRFPDLTDDQAYSPLFIIDYRVGKEKAFADSIAGDCKANELDRYQIAVSANRSPLGAKFWSQHPDVVPVDHRGDTGMTARDWAEFCAFYMTRVEDIGRKVWTGGS